MEFERDIHSEGLAFIQPRWDLLVGQGILCSWDSQSHMGTQQSKQNSTFCRWCPALFEKAKPSKLQCSFRQHNVQDLHRSHQINFTPPERRGQNDRVLLNLVLQCQEQMGMLLGCCPEILRTMRKLSIKRKIKSEVWRGGTCVIPILGRLRQEDYELEGCLGYRASLCLKTKEKTFGPVKRVYFVSHSNTNVHT